MGLLPCLECVLFAACLANLVCLNCPGLSFQFFAKTRKEPRGKHQPDNFKRKTRGKKKKDSGWCPEIGPGPREQMSVNSFVRKSVLRGALCHPGGDQTTQPPPAAREWTRACGFGLGSWHAASWPLSWTGLGGCCDICGQLAREEAGGRPHFLLLS